MQGKLYSIDTMYKKILPLLIFSGLFFSPLLHISIENSSATRTTWSGLILIMIALIAFFSSHHFRVQPKLLLLSAVIAASSFFLATYSAQPLSILLLLLITLICIGMEAILRADHATKVIFACLLLGCFSLYAQWGIAQFIVQHDLGMRVIGESRIGANISGVASFYIGSEKFIRAYGPFGHSNSFAGALLLGVIILYKHRDKLRNSLFFQGLLFILSLGIVVSFSRTALAGLGGLLLLFTYRRKWHLCAPLIITCLLFIPLLTIRSLDTHGAAGHERLLGIHWFTQMLSMPSVIGGFGIGNYTTALTNYLYSNQIIHNPWDVAPVHSVPLFLFAELGIIAFSFLLFFSMRFIVIRKAWILIVLLPALLLDHYFATDFSSIILLITTARIVVQ